MGEAPAHPDVAAHGARLVEGVAPICDARHSDPPNNLILSVKPEGVQCLWKREMASFYDRAAVSESAQGLRPVAFSTDFKSAALFAPCTLISRLTGKPRTWRKRAQERAEL